MPVEAGVRAARARALAVLRIRGRALALALLPAGVAVVLQAGVATGQFTGPAWGAVRWAVTALAVLVLVAAVFFGLVVTRSRPAVSPTVTIPESAAPDLYRLVRDLADRLEVPAPSAIALTPDCDSWLEDRTHPAHDEQPPPADTGTRPDSRGSDSRGPDSRTRADTDDPADQAGRTGSGRRVDVGLRVDPGARVDERAERPMPGASRRGAEAAGPAADTLPVLGRPGGASRPGHPGAAGEGAARIGNADGATGSGAPYGTGRRDRPGRPARAKRPTAAPVLVIGSPFLWWMRVAELRALLAPVVAGTGPSAHPDIAAARRFVRGLDAAVAVAAAPGRGPLPAAALRCAGWVARTLLGMCRDLAAEMERGVAAAAAERAQAVDYGLRIVAQEQVGLAYAGWDRLLTRVALPAWRMGRWPSRLDAGVVAALTELSRRDRLAEGFASRLGERPACDLLEEPGLVDEATSLLAARLFHGGPAEPGPDWVPVDWQQYPAEVVDRKWRADAARLQRVLDVLGVRRPAGAAHGGGADPPGASLARVMAHLSVTTLPEQFPESLPDPQSLPGPGSLPDPGSLSDPGSLPDPESLPERLPEPMPDPARGSGGADAVEQGGPARQTREAEGAAGLPGAPAPESTGGEPTGAETSEAPDPSEVRPGTSDLDLDPEPNHGPDSVPGTVRAHDPATPEDLDGPDAPDRPAEADPAGRRYARESFNAPGARPASPAPTALSRHHTSQEGDGAAHDGDEADSPPHTGRDGGVADPGSTAGSTGTPTRTNRDTDAGTGTGTGQSTGIGMSTATSHSTGTGTGRPAQAPSAAAPHTPRTRGAHEHRGAALAAELSAELDREEAAHLEEHPETPGASEQRRPDEALWDDGALPLFPMQPPRTARELLADHVTAMVCCAAVDTAGATPGLDWLDGPALLVGGVRAVDLAPRVLSLIEDGDPEPLRGWLTRIGVHPEKPVRLV
ncbi:hypothetical protein [Streptomyces sp. TS71-3]|uniref:hypothetical protein n=1 Tax=Streptomyces sp. TS71-3 TaxID=2733862 RepID=UPI001BB45695|nr:hypothetical protein [Streptomyces sp. TS71-3]